MNPLLQKYQRPLIVSGLVIIFICAYFVFQPIETENEIVTAPMPIAPVAEAPPAEPIPVEQPPVEQPVVEVANQPAPPAETPQTPPELKLRKSRITWTDEPLKLHWKTKGPEKKFLLEVSKNQNFKDIESFPVEGNQFEFQPSQIGTYFFRVKSTDGDPAKNTFSNLAKGQVENPKLKLKQSHFEAEHKTDDVNDLGAAKEFNSSWNKIPNAKKYLIEVSESSTFENAKEFSSEIPESVISVPQTGQYHFRISALDAEGQKIDSTSGDISYKKVFVLASPVIEKPFRALNFYFQKDFGQFVWLRWLKPARSPSSTSKYRLQIANNSKFENPQTDSLLSDTKFLLKGKLTHGEYFWRVRLEEAEQTSDWSETAKIHIQTKSDEPMKKASN